MNQREKNMFLTRVRWHIYNKNFKEINCFEYSAFRFDFKIIDQGSKEDFIEFISNKNPLLPHDLCNFFISKKIKFKINFRYVKGLDLKANWTLFKYVLFLKKSIFLRNVSLFFKKIKINQFIDELIMWNRGKPWYKFYFYYRVKKNIDKHHKIIESAYEFNYLYPWQYKKLLKLKPDDS